MSTRVSPGPTPGTSGEFRLLLPDRARLDQRLELGVKRQSGR